MKTPLLLLSVLLVACGSSEQEVSLSGAGGASAPGGATLPAGSSHGGLRMTQKTGPDAGKELVPPHGDTLAPDDEGLRFVTPEGWIESAPEGGMRHRQYSLPGEEGAGPALAVVARWQNDMGGADANVDMWVQQAGSDKSASELTAEQRWNSDTDRFLVTHVHVKGSIKPIEGMAKTIVGTDAGAILAAFVEPVAGTGVWTIKITGPAATVEAHKERYKAFVAGL